MGLITTVYILSFITQVLPNVLYGSKKPCMLLSSNLSAVPSMPIPCSEKAQGVWPWKAAAMCVHRKLVLLDPLNLSSRWVVLSSFLWNNRHRSPITPLLYCIQSLLEKPWDGVQEFSTDKDSNVICIPQSITAILIIESTYEFVHIQAPQQRQ